jgi:hypothetical protein
MGSAKNIAVRVLIAAIGIGLWFGTQSLIASKTAPASGIGDGVHQLTAPLNEYLHQNPKIADGLLIVSSAIIDALAIFILSRWIFGKSVRPLLGFFLLMGLRQTMQALCSLSTPEGMIWHDPGVPSLLVTYGVANDLFFSGHTATAVFAATELARLGMRWLWLGVVLAVFEAATVLVLRAHYTMDVFTGIIAALYVAHLAERLAHFVDRRVLKASTETPMQLQP